MLALIHRHSLSNAGVFRKRLAAILLLCLLLIAELRAGGIHENPVTTINVSFSFGAEWLEIYQTMEILALRASEKSGSNIEFKFWYADGNLEKESLNIERAINSKPDVLVLMPISAEHILQQIEHAYVMKIPVIVYNRMQKSHTFIQPDVFIGLDTYNQAYTTAIGLFKLMQQDGIAPMPVLLLGDLRDNNSINRRLGFIKAANDFGVEILKEIETDWNAKKAAEGLDTALKEFPNLNAILLSSDFMITEIKKVLSNHQRWAPYGEMNHVYLGAQDVFKDAIPLIRSGYIDIDTAFDIWSMSTTLIQVISTLASGEKPSQKVFLVPGKVITQKNIDSIKDLWSLEIE
ncbi:MAG: sugar ABC transporter substrate-binding protein [Spirochaetia bacterium]|nr:sugar ABC transporter substrate-binding protein [Spirochaetia bacterium]